jgi:hypothetical protein
MTTVINRLQSPLSRLLLGVLLLSLSSCAFSQSKNSSPPNVTPLSPETPSVAQTSQPLTTDVEPASVATSTATPTIAVTLYKADRQCEGLVSETVQVPAERSMEASVGKVIEEQSNADFALVGYRVSRSTSGVATVDLRLAPNSQRQIVSLSSCERLALFGSLRETLTRNAQWNIQSVRFTERGKDIVL